MISQARVQAFVQRTLITRALSVPSCCCLRRRLVRPLLLSLLSAKLRPGGLLHVATDVEVYAEHTARIVAQQNSRSPKPPAFTGEREVKNTLACSLPSRQPSIAAVAPPPAGSVGIATGERERFGNPEERKRCLGEQIPPAFSVVGTCGPQHKQAGGEGQGSSRSTSEEVWVRWEGGETAQRPSSRPLTKYEEKAREAGRRVRDLKYRLELPAARPRPAAAAAY